MERPRLFYCYSPRLARALIANGYEPICMGLNFNSYSMFWLFWGDEIADFKDNIYPKERKNYKDG